MDNLELPFEYRWLRDVDFRISPVWHWIDNSERTQSLREEFLREIAPPNPSLIRDLYPFATRSDDLAAFVIERGLLTQRVVLVHLTWTHSPPERNGFPSTLEFSNIWEWIAKTVLPDMEYAASHGRLTSELLNRPSDYDYP